MRVGTLLATLVAAALVAAGCGDDDDGDATSSASQSSGETQSQEDFVAEFNDLCDEVREESDAAAASLAEATTPEEIAAVFEDEVTPFVEDLTEQFSAIPPPEGAAEEFERFVEISREASALLAEDAGAIFEASANGESNEQLEQLTEINEESRSLASELGIPSDCGDPSGASAASPSEGGPPTSATVESGSTEIQVEP